MTFEPVFVLPLSFAVAFLTSFGLTPLVAVVARRHGFVDRPSPRRDGVLKPRLGGVAVYIALVMALALTYPLLPGRTGAEMGRVAGLLLGGGVVVVIGALDDRFELPALAQLAGQVLAAAIALAGGILIDQLTNPFASGLGDSLLNFPLYLAVFFTFFWLLGSMNTMNFLDGVDGLAAGVAAVAAAVLAVHSLELGQITIGLLPLALAGACLGFLPFNFYPARITLGTCGSVFLGFSLGALSVIGGTKAATLLLVLGLPVVDTGWTIARRMASGQSPMRGDRGHLHHRLLALGLSERQIVLLMYGASVALGALALLLSTRLAKFYALGIMTAATLLLVATLAYYGKRQSIKQVEEGPPAHSFGGPQGTAPRRGP